MGASVNITCPECGFSRNVSKDRLPGEKVMATCPKCSCRFPVKIKPDLSGNNQTDPREEEEDIRVVASKAYQREAERFKTENEKKDSASKVREGGINPWDNAPGDIGWAASFYQTVLRVMFAAPQFFGKLGSRAQIYRPLTFYLIIICFQILIERMWGEFFLNLLNPGVNPDPQLEKLLALLSSQSNIALSLLFRSAILVLQLYIFSFLLYLVFRLMVPGRATFALLFQIFAYSSAPALLCVIPVVGSLAGMFWSLGCLLVGCRSALNLDWARTIIGFLPILFLIAPLFFQILELVSK